MDLTDRQLDGRMYSRVCIRRMMDSMFIFLPFYHDETLQPKHDIFCGVPIEVWEFSQTP